MFVASHIPHPIPPPGRHFDAQNPQFWMGQLKDQSEPSTQNIHPSLDSHKGMWGRGLPFNSQPT